MAIQQRLTDDELKALADLLLAPEMADLGLRGVDLEHRDNFEDGPSLHVGLKVGADVPSPFDSNRPHRLRRILFGAMLDVGDERFPHKLIEREGDERPEPYYVPVDP